jgi:transposase
MHVICHQGLDELKALRRKAHRGMRDRLQMVILAMEGHTAPQVAVATGASRRTIQSWVHRYNRSGLDGLVDHRGGNHRHLEPEQEQQICQYLDQAAGDPQDGIRRGEDLRQWIHRQFGVLYTLTGVYELLHRLGYSCLMPRPRHAQADPQAQAEFKKKRPHMWRRSPDNIRANGSKSGSKTKRDSGSKAR